MKPRNFPARKQARQLTAVHRQDYPKQEEGHTTMRHFTAQPFNAQEVAALQHARTIRTKKHSTGRAPLKLKERAT